MSLPAIPLAGKEAPCTSVPCSQCCHDIEMVLTPEDLERLGPAAAALGIRDWHFVADDGLKQLHTRDGPPARGSPGGRPCVFLGDDGRCRVWEVRPEGCRLYPAIWDEVLQAAVLDDDYCPYTHGFRVTLEVEEALRRLVGRLHS